MLQLPVDLDDFPILARIFLNMFNFWKYVWRKLWLTWVTCRVSQNGSQGNQFSKIYVLLSVVDLGDFQSSLKYFSRCSNFENMCGVISGWLGWLARMDSCEVQFSKMYVSQILLKWVTCHSLATIFFERLYPKHICRNWWLTWVTSHFSQKNL